jgi:hypothetical protein
VDIQINAGNRVRSSAGPTRRVESVVEAAPGRFGELLTWVEAHLSDEDSSQKNRGDAIRIRRAGCRSLDRRKSRLRRCRPRRPVHPH